MSLSQQSHIKITRKSPSKVAPGNSHTQITTSHTHTHTLPKPFVLVFYWLHNRSKHSNGVVRWRKTTRRAQCELLFFLFKRKHCCKMRERERKRKRRVSHSCPLPPAHRHTHTCKHTLSKQRIKRRKQKHTHENVI